MFRQVIAVLSLVFIMSFFAFEVQAGQESQTITQDQVRDIMIKGYAEMSTWDDASWMANIDQASELARKNGDLETAEKLQAMRDPQMRLFILEQSKNKINEMSQNGIVLLPFAALIWAIEGDCRNLGCELSRLLTATILIVSIVGDQTNASEV